MRKVVPVNRHIIKSLAVALSGLVCCLAIFCADTSQATSANVEDNLYKEKLLTTYNVMASKTFAFDSNEVDKSGEDALKSVGEDRIYRLWRVLYAYKDNQNAQKFNYWHQKIVLKAQQDGDASLDLLARIMLQAYENETGHFDAISDKDWHGYKIAATTPALKNIISLEQERRAQFSRNWAEAIDIGNSVIISAQSNGDSGQIFLAVAKQVMAFNMLSVGDYNSYADDVLSASKILIKNGFFLQKMALIYDLAYFAASDYDTDTSQKFYLQYDFYVKKYNISDLKKNSDMLCSIVAIQEKKYALASDCLKETNAFKGNAESNQDAQQMMLLATAYARSGQVGAANFYISRLKSLPTNIFIVPPLFLKNTQAYISAGNGNFKEAFLELSQYDVEATQRAEKRRIAAIQDMYKTLRKELDSKTAEARLLNQQVQLRNWLLGAAVAIVLLLVAIAAGSALWVVRMRRMQWRLKEASDHAEAANAAKSRFLAVMSHELRTPLNGVLGMAQALKRENLSEAQRAKVETLAESGETLLMLLNDVLDMSRIEAGKVELSPTPASMKDMIERVFNTFAPTIGEKPVALKYDIDASIPATLSFDMLRVYQCLSNLVSNAVKFTNEGVIRIVASAEKHLDKPGYTVRVEVRDTGIGIAKAALGKLFEAYSQADASTARKYGGSGLGLSITRRLTELMGGSVSVTSEEGAGSVFVMTFEAGEVAPAAADTATETAPEDILPHGVRILLVDDHPVNRKVARLFLEPFGFDITEAVDGQEALDAGMEDYDLILMDVNMPRLGGIDATRQFRATEAAGKHVPIIALTADALPEQIEACLAAGMDAHVSKPIVMDKLIDTVVSLLGEDIIQAAQSA